MCIIPTVFKQDVTKRQTVHVYVMKARVGWKVIEILSVYFGARWRWGVISKPARFVHGKENATYWKGGGVDLTTGLGVLENRETSLPLPWFQPRTFQPLSTAAKPVKNIYYKEILFNSSKKCFLWPRPWDKPTFTFLNLNVLVWLTNNGILLLIWNSGTSVCD